MTSQFDVIVIGAGHNGLVTAGYLSRAGLKVLVLERREVVGGACVTEESFPGYRISTAAYLCSLLSPTIVRDLRLADFGYHIFPKDPASFTPMPDGRYLLLWQDIHRTVPEVAKFSAHDANQYPRYEALLSRLGIFAESLFMMVPPNLFPTTVRDWKEIVSVIGRGLGLGTRDLYALFNVASRSVRRVLDAYFESEVVKATLATDGTIGVSGGPSTPGTGYVLLHHCMGEVGGKRGLWGFVRGGMGAITQAMRRSAETKGAVIRVSAPVSRILVRSGKAYGVVLESGEELEGSVIVSNADPKRTFLKLMAAEELEESFRKKVQAIKMEGYCLKINLALGELPDFRALPGKELGPQHRGTIHICPSLDYLERAWIDASSGTPSENPHLECCIPTAYDSSLAPPGKHVMSIFVQYAPYELKEGSWDHIRNSYADRVLATLAQYAPNLPSAIIHRQILTPVDLERDYGLTRGHIFHGEMSLDQLYCLRPLAGWARYRTPIRNLYLCGSGAHPGGGVTGVPGYHAAREILRDLRRGSR